MSGTTSFGYLKAALLALIIGAGLAGGLIIGFSFTSSTQPEILPPRKHSESAPISWTTFKPGDAYPLENYLTPTGDSGSFDSLLNNHENIVLFVDWACDACLELLRYVQTDMLRRLNAECRVVVITDIADGGPPVEYGGLIRNTDLVIVNGDYWKATYHTVMRPTIVAVDNSGIVLHVQFGYDGFLDYEIVKRFFKKK